MKGVRDIYFIRHGQSFANAGLPCNWPDDVPLTEKGQAEAEAAARFFDHLPPDLVITSRFTRTGLTAAPLLARYPDCPQEEWGIEEFTYLEAAPHRGTTHEDRRPYFQAYWERSDPHYVDGDGAESFAGFFDRIYGTREQLHALSPGRTLIFCHGFFLSSLMWGLLFSHQNRVVPDMHQLHEFVRIWRWPNCGILRCRLYEDGHFYLGHMRTEHLSPVSHDSPPEA